MIKLIMNDGVMVSVVNGRKEPRSECSEIRTANFVKWGEGCRLLQIPFILWKNEFYGNLPSSRIRNSCVSMRV